MFVYFSNKIIEVPNYEKFGLLNDLAEMQMSQASITLPVYSIRDYTDDQVIQQTALLLQNNTITPNITLMFRVACYLRNNRFIKLSTRYMKWAIKSHNYPDPITDNEFDIIADIFPSAKTVITIAAFCHYSFDKILSILHKNNVILGPNLLTYIYEQLYKPVNLTIDTQPHEPRIATHLHIFYAQTIEVSAEKLYLYYPLMQHITTSLKYLEIYNPPSVFSVIGCDHCKIIYSREIALQELTILNVKNIHLDISSETSSIIKLYNCQTINVTGNVRVMHNDKFIFQDT